VVFTTDGSTWSSTQKIVRGTAVSPASGTSVSFTSFPSWAKQITLMFAGVSTNGSSDIIVQLGTGGTPTYTTSGYLGSRSSMNATQVATANFSSGFLITNAFAATLVLHGSMVLTNIDGNSWVETHTFGRSDVTGVMTGAGSIALGAALTAIRATMVNGTDTFDAGIINILYE
jgi:hypothetical protein